MDGKTGKTTNFAVPIGGGSVAQSHGILLGPDGHVYFNASPRIPYLDGDLGIVDTRAQKIETVKPPDGMDAGQRLAGLRCEGQNLDGERHDATANAARCGSTRRRRVSRCSNRRRRR